MKINDIKIADLFLDVLETKGQAILDDIDAFEDAINSYSPRYYEECYLMVQGVKLGLFDVLMLNTHILLKDHISLLKIYDHINKEDALFMISMIDHVIHKTDWIIQIVNIEETVEKAKNEENIRDLHALALAYFDGMGTAQDFEMAYSLFEHLEYLGDDESYYYLGLMNEQGLGVEINIPEARRYYELGASLMENECFYALGILERKLGEEEAGLENLKESEDPRAYYALGVYHESLGHSHEAFLAYLKGAGCFDFPSLYKTGMFYLAGSGTLKDEELAIKYLTYAYYGFHEEAAKQLGLCFIEGIGGLQDIDHGLLLLEEAYALGSEHAGDILAQFYERGQYVAMNKEKAAEYRKKAANENL